jgi:uncharacterized protein GlcG (DUF336 family)
MGAENSSSGVLLAVCAATKRAQIPLPVVVIRERGRQSLLARDDGVPHHRSQLAGGGGTTRMQLRANTVFVGGTRGYDLHVIGT